TRCARWPVGHSDSLSFPTRRSSDLEVIPEEIHTENDDSTKLVGYTDNYMKVILEGSRGLIGEIVRVKTTKSGYPYNQGVFVMTRSEEHTSELQSRFDLVCRVLHDKQ